MKNGALFLYLLLLSNLSAAIPMTDATLIQKGNEYSAISRAYEKSPKITGWIEGKGDSIFSPWARHWAEYSAHLTSGIWNIGLNVSNHGNLGNKGWYKAFKVHSELTDSTLINSEILKIKASDQHINAGLSSVDIQTAGTYTVRYTWLNDKWGGRHDREHKDANIQIHSVFFNRVPEPSSLALLSLGALILLSRKGTWSNQNKLRCRSDEQTTTG